ncbi:alpha/beta hydrolase [Catenovulum sp. 2E275]|uniref:alpha/beta hydrolase family protein n=1 Tax=Catenovulum sp. 2E275 TaxID=2980497 RepID=UPI0021CEB1DD|nr:CocE/NonD family hydrolase [Catenovulum sp. 2E275]MCU4674085.1 alpha/beta hydrolase [Catenovulum sp. 2E275]
MQHSKFCSRRNSKPAILTVLFIFWICTISVHKATADTAPTHDIWQGDWQGQLKINPSLQLTLILHIHNDDNQLTATLDSPDQGAFAIPVNRIHTQEQQIEIVLNSIGATYTAQLHNHSLVGNFSQGGNQLPLTLQRQSFTQASEIAEKLARPQEPKAPYPYIEEDISYPHISGEFSFAATLTKPKGKGNFTAAILISGSGPQDRDENIFQHKPFKVIADHLTRQGYAVLRFDDRGTAKSGGQFADTTMEGFASDVKSAYQYLLTRSDINHKKIGLIGHSEGGITGPIFAAQQPDVAFVIMLAGVGVPGKKLWATQQRDIGIAAGMPNGQFIYNLHETAAQMAIDGASEQQITKHFMQVPGIQAQLVKPIAQLLSSAWGRSLMAYEPQPILSKLQMPLLAINGELDMQVASTDNLHNIQKIMVNSQNDDVTIVPLAGLNHLLQKAQTGNPSEYAQINETVNAKALTTISNWLNERF